MKMLLNQSIGIPTTNVRKKEKKKEKNSLMDCEKKKKIDLLITGSKDGSFRIWDTRFNQKPAIDSGMKKKEKGSLIQLF
jgi:WD40 repeat protein